MKHYMIPGSHEWPRIPECRCGAHWDYWGDRCLSPNETATGGDQ